MAVQGESLLTFLIPPLPPMINIVRMLNNRRRRCMYPHNIIIISYGPDSTMTRVAGTATSS